MLDGEFRPKQSVSPVRILRINLDDEVVVPGRTSADHVRSRKAPFGRCPTDFERADREGGRAVALAARGTCRAHACAVHVEGGGRAA